MVDLNRTPEQLTELDDAVARMRYERAVAPDLAARYDDACRGLLALENERNTLRRRVDALEGNLAAATHFLVGPYRIGRRRDQWEVWPDPARTSLTDWPEPDVLPTLDAALAHAQHLTATTAPTHTNHAK